MYPMKIIPAFKDYLWGGTRLETEFGFKSGLAKTAEAWILSAHEDGENIISNGIYSGKSFKALIGEHPDFIKKGFSGDFPLLIKFIDAKDNLSVQVHPNEEYAVLNENDHGKTEAWYILDAEEDARLILGFKEKISREKLKEVIESETLLEYANSLNVKKGEIYFIPSGTMHAIGKGIVICEVQQNSNVTYRLYDYGRIQNGKKRPLHIEKALDVLDFEPYAYENSISGIDSDTANLVTCDIFSLNRINISGEKKFIAADDSFVSLVCVDGNGEIHFKGEKYMIKKGDSYFIPASSGEYILSGRMTVLETKIP